MLKASYTALSAKRNQQDEEPREQLLEEGRRISEMIEFSSVVPERENLPYYIISMQWFHRWQKYTGCFKVDLGEGEEAMEIDAGNKIASFLVSTQVE